MSSLSTVFAFAVVAFHMMITIDSNFLSTTPALHRFIEPLLDHRLILSSLIWSGSVRQPHPQYWRRRAGVDTLDPVLLSVYINESGFIPAVQLRLG